jgi:O-antigen/teichoic acid export membrane protein
MTDSEPVNVSHGRFGAVVLRLTGVSLLLPLFAFITSPILARVLGPVGRGQLAAIFAVVSIAPWISELGMTSFLAREHSRASYPVGTLLGSTMPIALAASLVGVVLCVPIAHLVGGDRTDVVEFIEIGLLVLPLAVFSQMLYGVAVGAQHWGLVMSTQILSAVGTASTIVILALLHALTVKTAATAYIVFGVVASAPYLAELRGSRPWRFNRPLARNGLVFGVRSWLSTVANTANYQLDQLLMAGLVSSRQLGLYSLAATVATVSSALINSTASALIPRVAAGESELVGRACRVTLSTVLLFGIGVGSTSPVVVPFVFGSAFDDMIPMLVVLLGASVFSVVSQVLGSALIAGGNPSAAARSQLAGLAITVPALIVVLPFAGGLGAAWVTLAAYGVTLLIALRAAAVTFALSYWTLLVITRQDLRWCWLHVRRRIR